MKFYSSVAIFLLVAGFLEAALPPENPMPGGYFDRDTNDETIQDMASFAAGEMNHKLIQVLAAQSQVVAGFNYRMELLLKKRGNRKICVVVVLEKLMDEGRELTSKKCRRIGDDDGGDDD